MSLSGMPSARDQEDARRLGEALERDGSVRQAVESADLEQVHEILVRSALYLEPTPDARSRMWGRIEASMVDSSSPARARIYRLTSYARWAAVAAVLLVSVLFYWHLQVDMPAHRLLAEAGPEGLVHQASDGSVIQLRPHSRLFSVSDSDEALEFRLVGEAYFEVSDRPDRTFTVATEHGAVTVLGTSFNVSTWGGRTEVFLQQGRLRVSSPDGSSTATLDEGMVAILSDDRVQVESERSEQEYLDWTQGEVSFRSRPAGLIAAELEHHFNVSISLDPWLAGDTISGTLPLWSAEETLRDLASVLGASVEGDRSQGFHLRPR